MHGYGDSMCSPNLVGRHSVFASVAFPPSLSLYTFFCLDFCRQIRAKKMAKKSFDAQSALAHVNYKPFYSYFGR